MEHQVPSSTAIEIARQDMKFQQFLSGQISTAVAKITEFAKQSNNQAKQQRSDTSQKVNITIANRLPKERTKEKIPNRHEREDDWTYNEDRNEEAEKRRRENRRDIDIRESND